MNKKKRSKSKKLLYKITPWLIWVGLAGLMLFITIRSFISLHNGASVQDVDSRKYLPVVSELVWMFVAAVVLLLFLKFFVKIKTMCVALVGVALLGFITWFGFWAFEYTHQDSASGFLTVSVIVGSVALITALALGYEAYKRKKRK